MQTFIMLTRLAHGGLRRPGALERLEKQVMEHIEKAGDGNGIKVEWIASYAVLGPYDYVDVFRAPDIETAMKISTIIRTTGHAHTEVWGATEWDRFKELASSLPE